MMLLDLRIQDLSCRYLINKAALRAALIHGLIRLYCASNYRGSRGSNGSRVLLVHIWGKSYSYLANTRYLKPIIRLNRT
jgi:hypothetical protein